VVILSQMQEVPRVVNPEEYLRRLRAELASPQTYKLEDAYNFQGKENPFIGSFDIDRDGKIAGFIADPNSPVKMHIVNGDIQNIDRLTILRFVKIPTGLFFADIYYLLSKPNDGEWSGIYTGGWQFQEPTLDLDFTPIKETSNQTMLTLSA